MLEFPNLIKSQIDRIPEKAYQYFKDNHPDLLVSFFVKRLDIFAKNTPIHYPSGFSDKYIQALKDNNSTLVIFNHQSHYDGFLAAKVCQNLISLAKKADQNDPPLVGFYMPIATSLQTGDQDTLYKNAFDIHRTKLEKENIYTVPVTRKKDYEQYGLEGSNLETNQKIDKAAEKKFGIVLFPEASVQGGRKKDDGNSIEDINGLQRPYRNSLALQWINLLDNGNFIVVYGAINGSYRILDSIKYAPTPDTQKAAIIPFIKPPKVEVTMGMPLRNTEVDKLLLPNHLNGLRELTTLRSRYKGANLAQEFLMNRIAEILPKNARGVYKLNTHSF